MITSTSKYRWLFKYKLYHIPFWFCYHYLWWSIAVGNPLYVAGAIFSTPYAIKNGFYVIFQALGVYFNLYYLIPKFLEKGRYVVYGFLLLLTIVTVAALIVNGYYVSAWLSGHQLRNLYGPDADNFFYFLQTKTLLSSVASMTLAMSLKFAKSWIQAKQREQRLEKEKLETELKFLKYQFNPHFLFNTINSIFFLIHKNPDKASSSLAKFSDLLRHQLYESNDNEIALSREIEYIENFIELERLRQNSNIQISTDLQKQGTGHLSVAPFILITFVENAFKHVSRNTEKPNWIDIQLHTKENELTFTVNNSSSDIKLNAAIHYGGIGLKNVGRRLNLVYPGQHKLDIVETKEAFKVLLTIQLLGYNASTGPVEFNQIHKPLIA